MNLDDFEKQLQEQPMRQVPGHWRAEILQAANAGESRTARVEGQTTKSWLIQLLWPNPMAWGALAAVWVVVFALNFADASSEPQVASSPIPSRETLVALKQQRQLRAELLSAANEIPPAEPPKLSAPHSRINPKVQIIVV
jgi:hypothetical protein